MTIVAAVDQSERSPLVINEGWKLADAFDVELHAVHVIKPKEFVDLERKNVEKADRPMRMEEIEEHAEAIARQAGNDLIEDFEAIGLVGEPSNRLIQYADRHNAKYIVIGGRKRSPVGKAIFGSITQSVILGAGRPVVAVPERSEK